MPLLELLVLAIGGVSLCITLLTYGSVVIALRSRRATRPQPTRLERDLPAISILKPLKGCDERLLENLRSFAAQVYPRFQIVLGCEDVEDPALLVARQLQREFPDRDITITAGAALAGNNPKVANLRQLVRRARHDLLLISDADVVVPKDYLLTLTAELEDARVGLVSNVIVGTGERTLGATLESLHLNTFIAGAICGADRIGHPCVVGKSMLMRQSDLERLDGWRVARDVLAEDYVLGQLFHKAGLRVALCKSPIRAVNPSRSVTEFLKRHVRWNQMRRHLAMALYWGEPLLLPGAWFSTALLLSVLRVQGTGFEATLAALAALVIYVAACALVARSLRGRTLSLAEALLVPVKDVMVLGVWLYAAFKTTVVWRGNRYRISAGSVLNLDTRPTTPSVIFRRG